MVTQKERYYGYIYTFFLFINCLRTTNQITIFSIDYGYLYMS